MHCNPDPDKRRNPRLRLQAGAAARTVVPPDLWKCRKTVTLSLTGVCLGMLAPVGSRLVGRVLSRPVAGVGMGPAPELPVLPAPRPRVRHQGVLPQAGVDRRTPRVSCACISAGAHAAAVGSGSV